MSKIDELIAELAPDGVEFKRLGEVGDFIRGNGLQKSDLTDQGIPAIHYGQIHTRYGIWTGRTESFTNPDLAVKLRRARPGDLIIATTSEDDVAVAKATAWVGEDEVAVSGDAYIYRHSLEPKYVAYFFQSEQFQKQKTRYISGTKVRRISGTSLAKIAIPVPPLEIQREIVRILDQFTQLETELEAELKTELEARRQQYEHYRMKILTEARTNASLVELSHLGRIVTGRTPRSSDLTAWGSALDFITPSDVKNGMKVVSNPSRRLSISSVEMMSKIIVPAKSILVTCIGADMGKTVINANDCITNQQINAIIPIVEVDIDYVFHVLTSMRDQIRSQGERAGGTMPIINKTNFSKIRIPLPPLPTQRWIANHLNTFDALVNDLSIGLPAELEARRKQYEYYRDKLLTFTELEESAA